MKSEWRHQMPRDYYGECVKMFGKPNAESWKRGGFAVWYTKGLFSEHILRDEDVRHCVPRPHHDYFYSSVLFYVPDDKLCDVLRISGSLNYDGLKKLLTARCGGIGANYATLYLAMAVASGKLSIDEVKKADMYPDMISGKLLTRAEAEHKMIAMKKDNNKRYAKEIAAELATYAYKKCYKKSRRIRGGVNTGKTVKRSVTKKISRNTRDQLCSNRNWTSCCPHMPPDHNGRLMATNEKSILEFPNGKCYNLHTCCGMCAKAMQSELKNSYESFVKHYKPEEIDSKTLWVSNRHTGQRAQKLHRA